MKNLMIVLSLFSTSCFADIEMNRDEVYPKKANVQAGATVIVNAADRNRDVVGAVVGGVIGGGFTARSVIGAAVGAYMARPSGSGKGGSGP